MEKGPSRNDYSAFKCDGTVFHSGDAWDYAIKLSVEVSAVLRSE